MDSPLPRGQMTNDQFSSAVKWGSWGCLPHQGDGRFKCTDINTSKVLRIVPNYECFPPQNYMEELGSELEPDKLSDWFGI